ncbi:hypothetical protein L2729_15745 [Shewanella gelidimarina]|uniref:hypothetical protein n=1 Tax=Shewanella gelidimarina TaxID=56813 RepID=UPI002010898C|nr:hypothetical protein [Shewanella gelidimarina]MCL1059425.1 hypothetical protein [Shewanella gelidimarina]
MKIEQSRSQYIFNLIYTQSINLAVGIFVISAISMFSQDEPSFDVIYVVAGAPAIFALWLSVFNSGESKIVENGIIINQEGFTYVRFNERNTIKWSQYDGYTITGSWLRIISIKRKAGSNIAFSYYTFSSNQRRKVFDYLSQIHY